MTACSDFEVLLSLRAAGALEPGDAARVEEHLAACAGCRAEADALVEALSLARLPPPSADERRVLAGLPAGTLDAFRRSRRRRGLGKRIAVGFAIAAAATAVVLAPAVLRKAPTAVAPEAASVASSAAPAEAEVWEAPDPDTLWADAALFDDDSSTATGGGDATDAVIAALRY